MNLDLFQRWTGWLLPRLADHLWQSTLIGLTILLVVYLLHQPVCSIASCSSTAGHGQVSSSIGFACGKS